VRDLIVEGRSVVRQGQMMTLDLAATVRRQNQLAQKLIG
jgi:hypothetical protein